MKKILSTMILGFSMTTAVSAITLRGASQFDNSHAYNRGMLKFGELLAQCDVSFKTRLQGNSSLGNEKDFLNFMAKGNAVDYAIVSPGHMANYSNAVSLLSMPFLFRSKDHWKAVINSHVLDQVNADFAKKADVIVLGIAGGSIRNIISNVPVASASDVAGLKIRVQGAPIHTKMWSAFGAHPAAINYNEVYNAIQTNVVNALEIEGNLKTKMKTVNNTDNSLIKNDIVMVLSDVAHGNFLGLSAIIPNNNYVLNQRMAGLRFYPNQDTNIEFLRLFINNNQKYFKQKGQGSSQQNLSKPSVVQFPVLLPNNPKEQQKIADCLSSLDDVIAAQTKKLALLKKHKKGLLQQLFPKIKV